MATPYRDFIDRSAAELARATERRDEEHRGRVLRLRRAVLNGAMPLDDAHAALDVVASAAG